MPRFYPTTPPQKCYLCIEPIVLPMFWTCTNAARFGYRLSVLGYQVDKGEQNYRTSGRRTRRAAVIGYPITSRSRRMNWSAV